jgi:glutamate dehydrogenase (NAD(P)+)
MTVGDRSESIVHYVDPVEGFKGFLAFGGSDHRLAAGGCRVVPGLDEATITALADAMTLKQRLLGLAVDGAKAGIDYDPAAPGKREALRRFLSFLRPHLLDRFSMGSDRGTTWSEVESIGQEVGLASVKAAVAKAQDLEDDDFRCRLAVLDAKVGGLTVGQRRAGHAVAHAALAACEAAGSLRRPLLASIQGFGTLGRGAALSLAEAGVVITAIADEHGCVSADDGLDVHELVDTPQGTPLGHGVAAARVGRREAFLEAPVDVVVLAACEHAINDRQARDLHARAVVVGANLGLSRATEEVLHLRNVTVVPDFVGGCGGSASMDALFGPRWCPSAEEMLAGTARRVQALVHEIVDRSRSGQLTTREAAMALAAESAVGKGRPYGRRWAGEGLTGADHRLVGTEVR